VSAGDAGGPGSPDLTLGSHIESRSLEPLGRRLPHLRQEELAVAPGDVLDAEIQPPRRPESREPIAGILGEDILQDHYANQE
jgi:hypothetical protein